jgi:hypothetical protein
VLTKREENQLLVFERNVLRTICGPKIENGVYNHELDKEFNSPDALNVTILKSIFNNWSSKSSTSVLLELLIFYEIFQQKHELNKINK